LDALKEEKRDELYPNRSEGGLRKGRGGKKGIFAKQRGGRGPPHRIEIPPEKKVALDTSLSQRRKSFIVTLRRKKRKKGTRWEKKVRKRRTAVAVPRDKKRESTSLWRKRQSIRWGKRDSAKESEKKKISAADATNEKKN